jgi:ABC-type dipeptide/oligopeptide/nickel transport system ATPase component
MVLLPGVFLAVTVLAINLVGDGLRDMLVAAHGGCDDMSAILSISELRTHFYTRDGVVKAVDGVSLSLERGETLGIVGESGCGKSVTALSVMRLVPSASGRIVAGSILFDGTELLALDPAAMRAIRGNRISMIFQEPMTSLNPVMTVGRQIAETVALHQHLRARHWTGDRDARAREDSGASTACRRVSSTLRGCASA